MRRWRTSMVWLASIALAVGGARAQSPPDGEIAFDTWTVAEGLPQGSIYDILQTRDGYLWLATLGGLVRFDGVRFTVFEKATAPGIASNRFITLFEDRSGALWAGTEGSGVTRYAGGVFRTFTRRDGLPHDRVRAIDQVSNGQVSNGQESNGQETKGQESNRQESNDQESNGAILVQTERGIARLRGERFEPVSYARLMPLDPQAIPGTSTHAGISLRDAQGLHTLFGGRHHFFGIEGVGTIESRYLDQRGVLWCTRRDGSLLRVEGANVTRRDIPPLKGRVLAVLEDRERALWVALENEGVMRIRGKEITRFTPAAGLAGPTVAVIFEDREGNIWLGSLLNGLSRFRHRAIATISKRNGLPVDNIYPLLQRRNGEVWVGTWGKGLARIDASRVDPGFMLLSGQYVSALTEDRAGDVWAGTSGSGLFRIRDGAVIPVELPGVFVFALHEDRNGTMWVGTGDGLRALTDDHPLFRKGLREVMDEEPDVVVIAEAGNGREALELIRRHRPHVAIVDIEMPQVDGFAVMRAIREEQLPTRVVMLTMHKDETMLREAFALGASGYVLKHSAATEVLDSIRAVAAGDTYVSPAMSSLLMAGRDALAALTPTERRILRMIAEFRTSKEIAEELSVSFRTVETHRNNICVKLGLEGKHSLLKFATEHKSKV